MDGIPKGTPRQPQEAQGPQSRCSDWQPDPLSVELLALHRRAAAGGWRRSDYLAVGAALLARGRSRAGRRWCSLADRLAGGVTL